MAVDPEDVLEQLDEMRRDLTGMQVRVTRLKAAIASLDLTKPPEHKCDRPLCGVALASEEGLLAHLANVHGDESAHDRLMELDGVGAVSP